MLEPFHSSEKLTEYLLMTSGSTWYIFLSFLQKNMYGSHPFYLGLEPDGNTHGVFLLNSNAMGKISFCPMTLLWHKLCLLYIHYPECLIFILRCCSAAHTSSHIQSYWRTHWPICLPGSDAEWGDKPVHWGDWSAFPASLLVAWIPPVQVGNLMDYDYVMKVYVYQGFYNK